MNNPEELLRRILDALEPNEHLHFYARDGMSSGCVIFLETIFPADVVSDIKEYIKENKGWGPLVK